MKTRTGAIEEGSIRFAAAVNANPAALYYDYMLKDHLKNACPSEAKAGEDVINHTKGYHILTGSNMRIYLIYPLYSTPKGCGVCRKI